MVKLLLKWPNLYYSTSAFAPKHYNKDIIDFANTRGADKIIYAGYYPMGLDIDRIFAELPDVPFRDHVWPKFLYENAARSAQGRDRPWVRSPASGSSSCRTSARCSSRACCSPISAPRCCASTGPPTSRPGVRSRAGPRPRTR